MFFAATFRRILISFGDFLERGIGGRLLRATRTLLTLNYVNAVSHSETLWLQDDSETEAYSWGCKLEGSWNA